MKRYISHAFVIALTLASTADAGTARASFTVSITVVNHLPTPDELNARNKAIYEAQHRKP
jgi:hypothetical protein